MRRHAVAGGRSLGLLLHNEQEAPGDQVSANISCLLVGGEELYEHASRKLGIGNKEVTEDGLFSLEEVECMGACSWAPAIQMGYDFHHFVTPEKLDRLIDDIRKTHANKPQ